MYNRSHHFYLDPPRFNKQVWTPEIRHLLASFHLHLFHFPRQQLICTESQRALTIGAMTHDAPLLLLPPTYICDKCVGRQIQSDLPVISCLHARRRKAAVLILLGSCSLKLAIRSGALSRREERPERQGLLSLRWHFPRNSSTALTSGIPDPGPGTWQFGLNLRNISSTFPWIIAFFIWTILTFAAGRLLFSRKQPDGQSMQSLTGSQYWGLHVSCIGVMYGACSADVDEQRHRIASVPTFKSTIISHYVARSLDTRSISPASSTAICTSFRQWIIRAAASFRGASKHTETGDAVFHCGLWA
ncbi:hypothetical protein ACRALDRAFT_207108 [Sodiomyces alcalophilus JCM 7366]|uniref:uncharacterized protein n=1 Tax=Sodiomyces alcalophilus JCM 7366 TaxID=591952 RepID=UPI0039B471E6